MRSVADDLRRESRVRDSALSAEERIARALALGDDDAQRLASYRHISVADARRAIRATRQNGRRRSCAGL
jgi:hypothetical protein